MLVQKNFSLKKLNVKDLFKTNFGLKKESGPKKSVLKNGVKKCYQKKSSVQKLVSANKNLGQKKWVQGYFGSIKILGPKHWLKKIFLFKNFCQNVLVKTNFKSKKSIE